MLVDNELIIENLEDYHITLTIDANASSHVFLGESISSTNPHQRVLIKLLHATSINTAQERLRMSQALSSLQQLSHPRILPILYTGIYKDMPYIITEYLDGGSLQDRLQSRQAGQALPQEEAVRIVTQIAQALKYLHQNHMIHGNLKPRNVLFNAQNEVLLTDIHLQDLLSLENVQDTNTSEMSIYRSPEQIAGHMSEESDQYALGCLAYELFTGHKAFMIPSVNAPGVYYRTKALIAPGRLNPALPSYIEGAILKALSKEPAERYQNTQAFLRALDVSPGIGSGNQQNALKALAEVSVMSRSLTIVPEATTTVIEATKIELPHNSLTVSQRRSGKVRQTWIRRSLLAVIICLIIVTAGVETLFSTFNSRTPPKRLVEKPHAYVTTVATHSFSLKQTVVPTASTTAIATKPVTPLPTPGIATPTGKLVPNPTPTPVSTNGSVPPPLPSPPPPPIQVQVPLGSFFNNVGIGSAPGQANFDSSGFSYVAAELPPGGPITLNGISYQFPNYVPGTSDNIVTSGQTIPLTPGNYQQASLLMSASWGPASGPITIHYTDNSTVTTNVTVLDWCLGPSNGLNTVHRYNSIGTDGFATYIYVIPIALDSTRNVDALILPQSGGHMHIFAITLVP